jgi:hypothetical protein
VSRAEITARLSWTVLVLCVIVAGGLVFSGAQALAVEGERPTLENAQAKNMTEHGTRLEAQINPQGNETAYEFWLECQNASPMYSACEPVAGGRQTQVGHMTPSFGEQTVSVEMIGLQPGYEYSYRVAATDGSGRVESPPLPFHTASLGACNPMCPYISSLSLKVIEYGTAAAKKHAEEGAAEEKAKREVEATRTAQSPLPVASSEPVPAPAAGGVSLGGTSITVLGNGTALVKLECLGIASCRGKLTLTAMRMTKAKGKGKEKTSTVTIGTVSFSIVGDETKAVEVKLSATGHALLGADHGHLSAQLAILELVPEPANTRTVGVRLVQQKGTKAKQPKK